MCIALGLKKLICLIPVCLRAALPCLVELRGKACIVAPAANIILACLQQTESTTCAERSIDSARRETVGIGRGTSLMRSGDKERNCNDQDGDWHGIET